MFGCASGKHELTGTTPFWILQGRFGRATVAARGRDLVAHAHPQFNVLIHLGGDDITMRTADASLNLTDDTVILFNPWETHDAKFKNGRGSSLNLVFEIEQDWLASLLRTEAPLIQKLFLTNCGAITSEIRNKAEQLAVVISQGLTIAEPRYSEMIGDLITLLVQTYGDFKVARNIPMTGRPADHRIRRAIHHIRAHAAANPNLDEIALEVGLSRSHFFHQFKVCVGISPQHYLDGQRMALAVRKLYTTNMPLAEVSHELSFSTPANFTRFFVQHIGFTPREYRRSFINLGQPLCRSLSLYTGDELKRTVDGQTAAAMQPLPSDKSLMR